jgi:hypothetical protein
LASIKESRGKDLAESKYKSRLIGELEEQMKVLEQEIERMTSEKNQSELNLKRAERERDEEKRRGLMLRDQLVRVLV